MQNQSSTLRFCTVIVVAALCLAGCEIGYYWQAATGHMALMRRVRPVVEVIDDPQTPAELRDKLVYAAAAVEFAHAQLLLPDNDSYRSYADLGRPYAVWNVVAAAPLSLEPRSWCFPVAGCVTYRGYFARKSANAFAADLRADGDDVFVGGVTAYSTLGRFADPLLNTVMGNPGYRLAGVIFHELAHQRLYVRDDTSFNEGFASFVEAEGIRRWLSSRGGEQALCRFRLERRRHRQVLDMLDVFRRAVGDVYEREISDAAKLEAKAALLGTIAVAYDRLKATWSGPPDFDHWFTAPFNNARFAVLAAYDDDVPAFAVLLAQANGDLDVFYERSAELAAEPAEERRVRLDSLNVVAGNSSGIDRPGFEDRCFSPGSATSEFAAANFVDHDANPGSTVSDPRPAH